MRSRQSYYEQGEKAGKALAWRIKQIQTEKAINAIQTDSGGSTDPKEIINPFLTLYHSLYSPEYSGPQLQLTQFNRRNEESLGPFELNSLTLWPAWKEEKTPGPDGIPTDLYKTF